MPDIKPLREGDRDNFETLKRAAEAGDLALTSSIRRSDGADVALVCAMNRLEEDGEVVFQPVPLAVMIEGNPYELFEDPTA
jgi:hypothetical protein